MEEILKILVEYHANFSVEFSARHFKIRVRQTGVWGKEEVWERPVFQALLGAGYKHSKVTWYEASTPTAIVEYQGERV